MQLVLTRKQIYEIYSMLVVMNAPRHHLQLFDVGSPAAVINVPVEYQKATVDAMISVIQYLVDQLEVHVEPENTCNQKEVQQ